MRRFIDFALKTGMFDGITYEQKIKSYLGSAIVGYWKRSELSGTVAVDSSGNARNGAYAGVTLNNTLSQFNNPAPYFDGASDYVDMYTALNAVFPVDAGTLVQWVKFDPDIFANATAYATAQFLDSTFASFWKIQKSAANTLKFSALKKSTTDIGNIYNTGWMQLVMTWDVAADQLIVYKNGVKMGATVTGLTAWGAMSFLTTSMLFGAAIRPNTNVLNGWLSDDMLVNRALTGAEVATIYSMAVTDRRLTIIGDSISVSYPYSWNFRLRDWIHGGHCTMINHAVAGAHIVIDGVNSDMPTQVSAAAADNAEIIIVELGTNENQTANARTVYAAQLSVLKASNPGAVIYCMGVLPKSPNGNRDDINAELVLACEDAGVPYWNTDGWIDPATDSTDGLHPNAGGHVKIENQVKLLISQFA